MLSIWNIVESNFDSVARCIESMSGMATIIAAGNTSRINNLFDK